MRLADLSELLECRLIGDGEIEIRGVAPIETAVKGDLTFLANPRYLPLLRDTGASAVILAEDGPPCERATLRTPNPYLAFALALRHFYREAPIAGKGRHPASVVAPDARIADTAAIGPLSCIESGSSIGAGTVVGAQVYIGARAKIGDGCLLYPQVVIREGVMIGNRVIIHSGAVIGSDGFGFARRQDGRYVKIPQVGGVVIEDDAEIGANVTIDRATLGTTRIQRGVKIDNLVQIAHNVDIGEDTILVAQAGIAGSTKIGRRVTIAGQAGLVGHITVGDDSVIGSQAGVGESVPQKSMLLGSPALPHVVSKRFFATIPRIPKLVRRMRQLEREVEELRGKLESAEGCP